MPSQARGFRKGSIAEDRVVRSETPLTASIIQQAIQETIDTDLGEAVDVLELLIYDSSKDQVYEVTSASAWPHSVINEDYDVVVLVDANGESAARAMVLPPISSNPNRRIIVHAYTSAAAPGSGWSLTIGANGSDTIEGATSITAVPATRIFYNQGTSQWWQIAAIDAPAVEATEYPTARALCTTNMDLSGTETVDGVSLSAGEIALCVNQTTGSQNGLQTVSLTGWGRPVGWAPQPGDRIHIREGSVFANTIWQLTNDSAPTVDTTAQTWRRVDGRLVVLHATDANYTVPNNTGRARVSFPNLTANRILTLPLATGHDGLEILVQVEANVAAARTVTFASQGIELINNNAVITGPWASALFVARNGNWNKMTI